MVHCLSAPNAARKELDAASAVHGQSPDTVDIGAVRPARSGLPVLRRFLNHMKHPRPEPQHEHMKACDRAWTWV